MHDYRQRTADMKQKIGIDNSVEIEFKCSDPYQEVLAFVAEVQNE